MSGFPVNPPRTPITDERGMVSPEWYRYFVALQRIVGGPSNPFEDSALLNSLPPQASAYTPPDDTLPPPHITIEVPEPLAPPTLVMPSDDLLYPPRYGA